MFGDWFKTLETTNLNKSYKMVVLRTLLESGQMFAAVDLFEFAKQCRVFMKSHEVLRRDLSGSNHAVDHETATNQEWADWWIRWPIDRWLAKQSGSVWFARNDDSFQSTINCPDHLKASMESLTEELVDWRLAAYTRSRRLTVTSDEVVKFEAKVSHSSGRPILFLPEKSKLPSRPVGPTSVRLPDGQQWEFKMVKVACNVATPIGEKKNQLGQLLQRWFGPNAGLPGTDFRVQFTNQDGEWHVAPCHVDGATVDAPIEQVEVDSRSVLSNVPSAAKFNTHVPVYDLSAAAGDWGPEGIPTEIGWIAVPNQSLSPGMFAACVSGQSMEPRIPSGSWCLFRPCPAGSREGRLLLVQVNTQTDPEDGGRYIVKRYHAIKQVAEDGWEHQAIQLEPLNTDYQPIEISSEEADDIRVVGEFVRVIEPVEE